MDLPEGVRGGVREVQSRLRSTNADLSFVDPGQAHFTIKFLGDTNEEQVPVLREILDDAAGEVEPFTVSLRDTGVFPDRDYISVVWIGADEGSNELERLFEQVEEDVVDRGLAEKESYDFTPHVTIARMKSGRGKTEVHKFLDETRGVEVGEFRVEGLRLKESVLHSDGPEYTTLHEAGLGGMRGEAAGPEDNS